MFSPHRQNFPTNWENPRHNLFSNGGHQICRSSSVKIVKMPTQANLINDHVVYVPYGILLRMRLPCWDVQQRFVSYSFTVQSSHIPLLTAFSSLCRALWTSCRHLDAAVSQSQIYLTICRQADGGTNKAMKQDNQVHARTNREK